MSDKITKKLNQWLSVTNGDLGFILKKASQINEINKRVIEHLDPSLKRHCLVGNLTKGQLTLIVSNGTVATQIRYLTPDLLRRFQGDPLLQTINLIQCKVRTKQNS